MWNQTTLAYMAGIMDGEGSLNIELLAKGPTRKYDYFTIRIVIVNTNLNLLNWVVANFNGTIIPRKKIEKRKQCYSWHLFSQNAIDVLDACLPFMIVKKQQALVLKEFYETVGKTGRHVPPEIREFRKELYEKLKKINQTGD